MINNPSMETLRRSMRRARLALICARDPERFTPVVLALLHSKARRQLKRKGKTGLNCHVLYVAAYGIFDLTRHEGAARQELRRAVDLCLEQFIREGVVIRISKCKVWPAVVEIRPGARMLFNGCPTDSGGDVALASA